MRPTVFVIVALLTPAAEASSRELGMRVNRALRATHSRREANRLITDGRLQVNGAVVRSPDQRLTAGDTVLFDGALVSWAEEDQAPHRYIKYNKPVGVECTTSSKVPNNIMAALDMPDDGRRVYPIGRLDAESSGLILLTSNGQIVNDLLRAREGKAKEYRVVTSPRASDHDIRRLASGIEITTVAQRDGQPTNVTAPTLPCEVTRRGGGELGFGLCEGRNRQIRRMCGALGLSVVALHRVSFAGVRLGEGCAAAGDWAHLTPEEELLIGARRPPTRSERRTPAERAARKAAGKRNR